MFFFNILQLFPPTEKPLITGVSSASWIAGCPSDGPQFVQLGSFLSDVVLSNAGALRGIVQIPFLFPYVYLGFPLKPESRHLQKLCDDSAADWVEESETTAGRRCTTNPNKTKEI